MKILKCEMCQSNELIKQEGFFVCQHCGCKYTVEEAKKLMVEGTVKIDDSEELKKLYQAARNAREISDFATAIKHYEKISAKDPNSWEALFYLVVLKANSITNGEIGSTAISISSSIHRVFQLVKETINEDKERKEAVQEIVSQCQLYAIALIQMSENFYRAVTKGNGVMALTGVTGALMSASHTGGALVENQTRYSHIANILCVCGDEIENNFEMSDSVYNKQALECWDLAIDFYDTYKKSMVHVFSTKMS